jgi:hypothetical protein
MLFPKAALARLDDFAHERSQTCFEIDSSGTYYGRHQAFFGEDAGRTSVSFAAARVQARASISGRCREVTSRAVAPAGVLLSPGALQNVRALATKLVPV